MQQGGRMLKIIGKFNKKEWLGVLCCMIFIGISGVLDLAVPDVSSNLLLLVQGKDINMTGISDFLYSNCFLKLLGGGTEQMTEILAMGLTMLTYAVLSFLSTICAGFCSAVIAASIGKRLRSMTFSKVQSFGQAEINKFSTASLITRSTNDVTQITMFIAMGLHMMIKAPIMIIASVTKIGAKNQWQWSLATAITAALLIICIIVIISIATPRFKRMQSLIDDVNRDMRENLTGLRVVRAYNAESFQESKFEKSNNSLTENFLGGARAMAFMNPMTNAMQNGLNLATYWIGAVLITRLAGNTVAQNMAWANMVTFSQYSMHVVMSFIVLSFIFMMWPRASVAAARINAVLDTETTIKDGSRTEGEKDENGNPLEGVVEFKNVSFKYPDAEECVLENISFKANRGETVAFIGGTGSGKSTVINLVPRFFDATEGEVLVDGVNVKDYKIQALNNKLGYVPQRAVLFSGDVKSNITYGDNGRPKPTDEQVVAAAEVAHCTEFIEKMPDKYGEHIAQGGTNVSGGQKQRMSIARAIARDPEIYIFDDSFSALDFKTDKELRAALKKHTDGATCLIVAQRIGTIKDADKIIVLQDGKMAGMGTHRELLKTNETYRQIALSQLSEEELAK